MEKFTSQFWSEDEEILPLHERAALLPRATRFTRGIEYPPAEIDIQAEALESISKPPRAMEAKTVTRQEVDPIISSLHRRGLHDQAQGRETYAGGQTSFDEGDYSGAALAFRKARTFARPGTPAAGAVEEAIARSAARLGEGRGAPAAPAPAAATEEALARMSGEPPSPPRNRPDPAPQQMTWPVPRSPTHPVPALRTDGGEGQRDIFGPPQDTHLTPTELWAEAARGSTPTEITDIARAQAESGGPVDARRPWLSPSERDAALEEYEARYGDGADAAPPFGRPRGEDAPGPSRGRAPGDTSLPVPALVGPGGESREEEAGLPPAPPPAPPMPPVGEVTDTEESITEESITEETPENERRVREAAEMIATGKEVVTREDERRDPLDAARRRAYITSGIMDLLNGVILGFAASSGGADPRVIAQVLANSEQPLEAFREMVEAARQTRQDQERTRRLDLQEERAGRSEQRAERQLEMREEEVQRGAQTRGAEDRIRDPASQESTRARARYVDALVDIGVDRETAQARVEGASGADVAARGSEVDSIRTMRGRYFQRRRGHRPTARGWQQRLEALGYGPGATAPRAPAAGPGTGARTGTRRRPDVPGEVDGDVDGEEEVVVEESSEEVVVSATPHDDRYLAAIVAASDPEGPGGAITTTNEGRGIGILRHARDDEREERRDREAREDRARAESARGRVEDARVTARMGTRNRDMVSAGIPDVRSGINRFVRVVNLAFDTEGLSLRQIRNRMRAAGPMDSATNIPGAGLTAGAPTGFLTSHGRQIQGIVGDIVDLRGRQRSGAAINEAEERSFRLQLGFVENADSDMDLVNALIDLQEKTRESQRRIDEAYPDVMAYLNNPQGTFIVYPLEGQTGERRRRELTGRQLGRFSTSGHRIERVE